MFVSFLAAFLALLNFTRGQVCCVYTNLRNHLLHALCRMLLRVQVYAHVGCCTQCFPFHVSERTLGDVLTGVRCAPAFGVASACASCLSAAVLKRTVTLAVYNGYMAYRSALLISHVSILLLCNGSPSTTIQSCSHPLWTHAEML